MILPSPDKYPARRTLAAASRLEALYINQVKRAEFVVVVVPLLLSLEDAILQLQKRCCGTRT
jgi:hypothetical protein